MWGKHSWAILFAFALGPLGIGQTAKDLKLETGEEIFQATCAGCHGPDGKGQPQHILGFEPPATFPDFTDCSGSTRESNQQWSAVIHQGGTTRAFSTIMPSFGPVQNPALTDDEIQKVIKYVRGFCQEDSKWPSGDFNFPRLMYTEKAFPEDEMIFYNTVNLTGNPGYNHNLIIEKRLGAITNMELRMRGNFSKQASGSWLGSVGDVSIEFKRSLLVNNKTGTLLGWGHELTLPTGNTNLGGNGMVQWEEFLTLGQILPKKSFIQQQIGIEGPPFRRHQNKLSAYTRTAVGKTFLADRGFGRQFSLMNEFVASRSFGPNVRWKADIVPQAQISLSRRQHMRLGVGVTIPVMNTPGRSTGLNFYLLWDTFDGGFFEGWR